MLTDVENLGTKKEKQFYKFVKSFKFQSVGRNERCGNSLYQQSSYICR